MLNDDEVQEATRKLVEAAKSNDNQTALAVGVALLAHAMCCLGTVARSLETVAGPAPKAPTV